MAAWEHSSSQNLGLADWPLSGSCYFRLGSGPAVQRIRKQTFRAVGHRKAAYRYIAAGHQAMGQRRQRPRCRQDRFPANDSLRISKLPKRMKMSSVAIGHRSDARAGPISSVTLYRIAQYKIRLAFKALFPVFWNNPLVWNHQHGLTQWLLVKRLLGLPLRAGDATVTEISGVPAYTPYQRKTGRT